MYFPGYLQYMFYMCFTSPLSFQTLPHPLSLQDLHRRLHDLQNEVDRLTNIIKGHEKTIRDRDDEIEVSNTWLHVQCTVLMRLHVQQLTIDRVTQCVQWDYSNLYCGHMVTCTVYSINEATCTVANYRQSDIVCTVGLL